MKMRLKLTLVLSGAMLFLGHSLLAQNLFVENNVGIGIATPDQRLHVARGLAGSVTADIASIAVFERDSRGFLQILTPNNTEKGILFGEPSSNVAGGILYDNSSNPDGLQFRTNGNVTRMVIDDAGDVGIGITTPDQKLHVQRGSAGAIDAFDQSIAVFERNTGGAISILTPDGTAKGLVFGETSNNLAGAIFYDSQAPDGLDFRTNGNVTRMVIDDAGDVGIGTLNPTERLDVDGRVRIRDLPELLNARNIAVDTDGNLGLFPSSPNINERNIENLQEENMRLKARLDRLEQIVSALAANPNSVTSTIIRETDATLQQNAPNPFTEATNISYFIPEDTKSASLQVMDQNGRIIKRIPIQATGKGQLTLQANLLSAGTYSYSLVLDGQVMETKQMVLTH